MKRYFRIYAGDGPIYWTVAENFAIAFRNVSDAMTKDGTTDEITELDAVEMTEEEATALRVVDDVLPEHMNGNMTMLELNDVMCSEYP